MISDSLSHQAYRMLTFKCLSAQSTILLKFNADSLLTDTLRSKSVCETNFTRNNFPIENMLYVLT